MDLIAEFGWSEHSYHHKNQWYSWAEKAVWSKCWDPRIPTDCGVHFPLCLSNYRLIVNTPTYITFGLAFSICGVQAGQWNRGNGLKIFPRNITNIILPRRPSANCTIYLKFYLQICDMNYELLTYSMNFKDLSFSCKCMQPSTNPLQSLKSTTITQLQYQSPTTMDKLPSTPPHTTHELPLQSTPIKTSLVTTQPYTTHHKFWIDSCSAMGKEMMEYILGLMSAQAFLDEFFPLNGLSDLKGTTHK